MVYSAFVHVDARRALKQTLGHRGQHGQESEEGEEGKGSKEDHQEEKEVGLPRHTIPAETHQGACVCHRQADIAAA
jgi:hypothetical protein